MVTACDRFFLAFPGCFRTIPYVTAATSDKKSIGRTSLSAAQLAVVRRILLELKPAKIVKLSK